MLSELRFQSSIDIMDFAMQNNIIGTISVNEIFEKYSRDFEKRSVNNPNLKDLSIKNKLDKALQEDLDRLGFDLNTQKEL